MKPKAWCKQKESVFWAFFKQPDDEEPAKVFYWDGQPIHRVFALWLCGECKPPYEKIPMTTHMDAGYYFVPK